MKHLSLTLVSLLTLTASFGQTLSTALDNADLTWRTGGNVAWFAQTTTSHDGQDAARSGRILEGQQSWVETTVSGPGVVTFWWKASSEGAADILEFSIGGAIQARTSGDALWKQLVFDVPSGSQVLRWRYVKDIGTDLGTDSGYLDQVVYARHEGPPALLLQPPDVKAGAGGTVRLKAGISGAQPLSFQWFVNETNLLANASTSELVLTNVQPAQSGHYRVAVSNALGSTVSGLTFVDIGTNGPAENIFLFVDGPNANPFQAALTAQGRPHQIFDFNAMGTFNAAVTDAHPTNTLVIVDAYNAANDFSEVINFVQKGGRAILQFWYLGVTSVRQNVDLATAFNARVAQEFSVTPSLYNWSGSAFFAGVTSPITFRDLFIVDGQRLAPLAGGTDVAGFQPSRTANQAGVIVGNSGRTILNGFFLEQATSSTTASRFAQNQIQFLVGPPVFSAPVISAHPRSQKAVLGASVTLTASAGGTAPLTYQWFRNDTLISGATTPTLNLNNLTAASAGVYKIVVSNNQGSTTSSNAVISVSPLGNVSSVLLLVDVETDNLYREALQTSGIQYASFVNEAGFNQAIPEADAATALLVVDAPKYGHDFRELTRFIKAGGRAIVEYWNFGIDANLSAALGISVLSSFSTPQPVYDWDSDSLFTLLPSPLNVVKTEFGTDGQNLQATGGARAAAGYTASPQASRAAIVISSSNRTIANGFVLENIAPRADAVQLVKNQLKFLGATPSVAAPFFSVQPQNQTVVLGATALFNPSVGGTPPLTFRWVHNGNSLLAGETNAALKLKRVQLSHVGNYSVVVSNPSGSVTSAPVSLRLTGLGPVTNILVFTDDANSATPFKTALNNLGLAHRVLTNENIFDSAVSDAPLESSLILIDCTLVPAAEFKGVEAFARAGGRAVLQFWRLAQRPTLAETFEIASLQPFSSPRPVYAWNQSPLFAGVSSPVQLASPGFGVEGQTLEPVGAAIAAAGFTPNPAPSEAAVIVGNSGRTIVNGFFLKEAVPLSAGVRVAQNQIEALLPVRVAIPGLRITRFAQVADKFELGFAGSVGAAYKVFGSADLRSWQEIGSASETSAGQFQFNDPTAVASRFYQVRHD